VLRAGRAYDAPARGPNRKIETPRAKTDEFREEKQKSMPAKEEPQEEHERVPERPFSEEEITQAIRDLTNLHNFIGLRERINGIAVFLLGSAVAAMLTDFRTALAVGLAAWAIQWFVSRSFSRKARVAFERSIEEKAREAGMDLSLSSAPLMAMDLLRGKSKTSP
jgi:hypothetical protein